MTNLLIKPQKMFLFQRNSDQEIMKKQKKYKIFKNDCNDFTESVLKEYEKLWKEDYKEKNSDKSSFSIWKAWLNHYKDISKRNRKIYDASK